MRLAHFLPTFPQPGGTSAVVEALVEASHDRGEIAEVFSYATRRPYHSLPWPARLPGDRVADGLLATAGLDAVLFHGVFTPDCSRLARLVASRTPTPVVAFPHDPYHHALFGTKRVVKSWYWQAIEGPYLRGADLIQVTAPTHRDLLRRRGVNAPIVVSPLGLRGSELEAAAAVAKVRSVSSRRSGGGDRLVCLFLGRWDVYEKSIDLLCQAVGAHSDLRDRVELRLAGPEVAARTTVERLLRVNGVAHAELLGFVPSIWPLFEEVDCLVLPSRKEGFGLAGLQALAAGVPVLISAASGLAEYVGVADGALVTAPDTAAIAVGLRQIVDERDQLAERALAGAGRIACEFTWVRFLDRLADGLGGLRSPRAGGSSR